MLSSFKQKSEFLLKQKVIRRLLLIWFLFNINSIHAQFPKGQAVETSILRGKIIPHTDETSFEVKETSIGIQVNYQWQTHGQKDWHELQKYPLFGLSFIYFDLGENDVFGSAFGIIPNLMLNFLKHQKKWNGYFHVGSGVAWLPTYYHPIDNPINNAIGSRLNNATLFKWGLTYKPSNQYALTFGGGLMHFSNGGAQLPNFGINIPVLTLGFRYFPNPLHEEDYIQHNTSKKRIEKWKASLAYTMAFREAYIIGGPRYPVYIASAAVNYFLNRKNKASIGLEYEYHPADFRFALHTFNAHSPSEAHRLASRLAISLANEFLFGNWTVRLLAGYYVGNFSLQEPFPVYFKLTSRYYFPPMGKMESKFFTGITLKSHIFRAEYIALGGGIEF